MDEPVYFLNIEGAEHGPYSLDSLREVWDQGLLAHDAPCRETGSNIFLPVSAVLGVRVEIGRAHV